MTGTPTLRTHTHQRVPTTVFLMLIFGAMAMLAIVAAAPAPPPEIVPISELASVKLADDDHGQALFAVSDLAPGRPISRCIKLDYHGASDTAAVWLTADEVSGSLAPTLQLTVELGSGGSFTSCQGFSGDVPFYSGPVAGLTQGPATQPGVATGWRPIPGPDRVRTYRITASLPAAYRVQTGTVSATFRWVLLDTARPGEPTPTPVVPTPAPVVSSHAPAEPTPAPVVPAEPSTPAIVNPPPVVPAPEPAVSRDSGAVPSPIGTNAPPAPAPAGTAVPRTKGAADAAETTPPKGSAAPARPAPRKSAVGRFSQAVGKAVGKAVGVAVEKVKEAVKVAVELTGRTAKNSGVPMASLVAMFVFLLAQDRFDRLDPKLALAPVVGDPYLRFGDAPDGPDGAEPDADPGTDPDAGQGSAPDRAAGLAGEP